MYLEINNNASTFPEAFGVDILRAELIQTRVLKTILSGRIQNSKSDQNLISDVNTIQEVLRIAESEKEIPIIIKGYVLALEYIAEMEKIVSFAFSMVGKAEIPTSDTSSTTVKTVLEAMVAMLERVEAKELHILAKQAQDDYGIV